MPHVQHEALFGYWPRQRAAGAIRVRRSVACDIREFAGVGGHRVEPCLGVVAGRYDGLYVPAGITKHRACHGSWPLGMSVNRAQIVNRQAGWYRDARWRQEAMVVDRSAEIAEHLVEAKLLAQRALPAWTGGDVDGLPADPRQVRRA